MIDNEDGWAHFNVRCPVSLRVSADEAAKKAGQSLAEWVRRAMQEKLERDKQQEIVRLQAAALADENKEKFDIQEMIRAVVRDELSRIERG